MKWLCCLLLLVSLRALAADLSGHVVKQEMFYGRFQEQTLEEKVRPAPPELIDFLKKDNESQGWPNRPRAASPSPEFVADVKAALRDLPESLRRRLAEKLVGVFLVEDLGGSAFSDATFGKDGVAHSGFVVLDQSMLDRKANEWATWKEASPFHWDARSSLQATIERPENDNRKNAVQYILLHEFGHILSIGSGLVPLWGKPWSETKVDSQMSYFHLSWILKDGELVSRYDASWPERSAIRYYADTTKKREGSFALKAYRKLMETNFPTLYSATNPFDDFADAFASYVHVEVLKKPWSVTVRSPEGRLDFKPCWQEARCAQKKARLQKFIE